MGSSIISTILTCWVYGWYHYHTGGHPDILVSCIIIGGGIALATATAPKVGK